LAQPVSVKLSIFLFVSAITLANTAFRSKKLSGVLFWLTL